MVLEGHLTFDQTLVLRIRFIPAWECDLRMGEYPGVQKVL